MDLPILTSAQMRAAEEAAFANGVQVEALMNKAGAGVAHAITKFFQKPGRCIVFAGKGHNAGDALVAAQCLERCGWEIEVRLAFREADCSDLMRKKLAELCRRPPEILGSRPSGKENAGMVATLADLSSEGTDQTEGTQNAIGKRCSGNSAPLVILDGLLGVGAKPPLREPIRGACRAINQLRTTKGAYVFAVDLPTGLDTDSGKADRDCVVADFTVTIGYPKPGLVADDAVNYVGRIEVVVLDELQPPQTKGKEIVASPAAFRALFPRRKYNSYKNQFGRIGVVAGSKGFVGAALMASQGALRAGAGLVEVFIPEEIYEIVAGAAFMEAMVKPITSYRPLLKEKVDVWAVGPGLGKSHAADILELVEKTKQPMVLDADGLNIVSEKTSVLRRCKGKRLLTPHPGEMKRLFSEEQQSRAKTVTKFCDRFPVTLLLKGSRTIVAEHGRPLSYNTTGNPGMATGGMGDVLTGVCAALLGQGLSPYDAGRVGAWLCGRAAEIAIFNGNQSEQSLLPRDVLDHLGDAFKEL
ncbi:MAG TPA: NAD(P)H-hydrate dehydratase [Candidatus Babeliales bacterium]|nr:NAD(P)H-hydrate dehydratase [Candidatus Babeliales bacterium]